LAVKEVEELKGKEGGISDNSFQGKIVVLGLMSHLTKVSRDMMWVGNALQSVVTISICVY
jgi:hypothetical protein